MDPKIETKEQKLEALRKALDEACKAYVEKRHMDDDDKEDLAIDKILISGILISAILLSEHKWRSPSRLHGYPSDVQQYSIKEVKAYLEDNKSSSSPEAKHCLISVIKILLPNKK